MSFSLTTRERLSAAWNGEPADHVPLTTWCFGFQPPASLRWDKGGRDVEYWYTKRMEHIHTMTRSWDLEDDFKRALAWQSLGVDDVLEVSIPWSLRPGVTWKDSVLPGGADHSVPVMVREYPTPVGPLRHAVRKTNEEQGKGWVVQPDHVPLIEDFNIPRAEKHLVASPSDVEKLPFVYGPPDSAAREWFKRRMEEIAPFAETHGLPVQAWSAFGMDAAVWFCGTEGAIMLALDHPQAFGALMEAITETDYARTLLAASNPAVDLIVQRGWYSSTDFWSPSLFDRFLFAHIEKLAVATHGQGKKFAYVMTTGVEVLGPRLADAGVDVLYFVDPADPVQKGLSLVRTRDLLGSRMTLVGGISSLTVGTGNRELIQSEVKHALEVFRGSTRFILHPVDALFPNTPWEGVEALIDAWRASR